MSYAGFIPTPLSADSTDEWSAILDENQRRLNRHDAEARGAGRLVGRYIKEQYADGYAYYMITRENKRTVRIRHIPHVSADDWTVPYWGEETTIDKDYAVRSLEVRDAFERLFPRLAGGVE